ncbi:unnamed protein product [Blepharisma stoltei]|uniref:PiggyBac transposable element-derived protein domain-containing protein n=1 Tax=Blepharisma stoltei TaxID=1481888 RepID=A0AAU9KA87_9CILI|nr:unnamed protein product [Blepharisma stoltei]
MFIDSLFTRKNESSEFFPENVCLRLLQGLENQNFHLYIYNWYNSIPLLLKLKEFGIECTGTIKQNRKYLPKDFKKIIAGINQSEYLFIRADQILLSCWHDKRMVVCAVNSGRSAIITKKRGKDEIITIPEIIEHYRQFMIGIDMFDQNKTVINQAISGMDWIIKIENTKECIFCYYKKGKKSRTPYICSESKIHLHPNCFYSYHNNIKKL